MVRLLRFAAVVALGGIATAGLSACSGAGAGAEGEVVSPSVSVVASPPPSVTPSPSVTPEEELLARIPEEARYESFPSAVEFSQFFIAEWDAMYRSLDTELVALLSAESCSFCENSLREVQGLLDKGHYFAGSPVSFASTEPRGGLDSDGHMNVTMDITISTSTITDRHGEIVTQYGEEQITTALLLSFTETGWRVLDVASEPR